MATSARHSPALQVLVWAAYSKPVATFSSDLWHPVKSCTWVIIKSEYNHDQWWCAWSAVYLCHLECHNQFIVCYVKLCLCDKNIYAYITSNCNNAMSKQIFFIYLLLNFTVCSSACCYLWNALSGHVKLSVITCVFVARTRSLIVRVVRVVRKQTEERNLRRSVHQLHIDLYMYTSVYALCTYVYCLYIS